MRAMEESSAASVRPPRPPDYAQRLAALLEHQRNAVGEVAKCLAKLLDEVVGGAS